MIKQEKNGIVSYQFESFDPNLVNHALYTRIGGVSEGPYQSFNLGGTCGDNPEQCLVLSNNLFGTPSMGIIDTNGNLTDKYKSYLGAQGWQIYSDNIPPLEPSGVKAIIAY